jgi:hypothetical protein
LVSGTKFKAAFDNYFHCRTLAPPAPRLLTYRYTETFSAKTDTLSAKTEKFSAKTEKFLATFGEF